MSTGTPRLNSAFPETPVAAPPLRQRRGNSPAGVGSVKQSSFAPKAPTTNPKPTDPSPSIVEDRPPLIPEDVIDAPTQRLYVVAVFVLLQAWKFYDIARLYAADGDSISELWFCVKWLVLDGCFFGFLPILRIPWLKFKAMFTLCAIVTFSVMDIFVSLKYQLPITAFFGVFWKLIYDRELSITERSVKWYDIVNNSSHIQGKYTLYYLPEGAAQINPESTCFCIGDTSPFVTLPIRINGTQPINIEIQRIDLESGSAEMISINHKELKRLLKKAPKEDEPQLRNLPYTVKQPGLYRLTRVTDVSQLEVRIYRSEALVVSCPKANLKISGSQKRDKCKGDMSDIAMEVHGLAPLQITYSREIKGKPTVFSVQSIHPEGFESPLLAGFNSDGTLAQQGDGSLTWAQRREIIVPLNESLASAGDWGYSIDKVVDGCGNTVDYNALFEDGDYVVPKKSSLSHRLMVHDRPRIRFLGCDPQTPIDLPKGVSSELPLQLVSVRDDAPYSVRFAFTPHNKLQSASEHSPDAVFKDYSMKGLTQAVSIKEPGLYSLKSFSSKFCPGEVMEPSSCLVITPPEPSMTMESDEILDKCTSSSIGLTIDLTLVGSPTFELSYRLIKDGGAPVVKTLTIDRTRHQVRFTPEDAGHYAYEFFSLRDKNYANVKLDSKINRVEQTVKPLAGANFIDAAPRKNVCIEEPVEFQVKMQGTPPLNLHYDLIHNGKRHRMSDKNITTSIHTIKTPPLTQGGEYALALTTVEDISGCKIYLESEAKVNVRWQRPKAQFAPVEGKMHVRALEGKPVDIPIRLTGESPWTVRIRNADRDEPAKTFKFTGTNSYLTVNDAGTYYLEEVRDNGCPGSVAGADSTFKISWIDRPKLRLAESVSTTRRDEGFVRQDVCEGDEDSVELAFTGSPPFMVDYDIALKPDGSSDSKRSLELSPQQLRAGLGVATVRLETSRAGLYQYKFKSLADGLYDNPKESLLKNPFTLEQTVHSRPTTSFANPSKVYKYCLDAGAGDDIIPIQLHGIAPFSLTINVKHFSTGKSDIINVPHVETNVFNFRIPNHALTLGSHAVSVLKVKDSRGCVRKTPTDAPHVMVAVADMPTITPHDTQRKDYCVGDRIAFTLAGVPPFAVGYEWNGVPMNAHNQPSQFIRVAEKPGNFTVTGLQDSASDCKVSVGLTSVVHEIPSVRISGGNIVVKGIAEGDQTEISFNFFGTPPFTFTYTRSEIAKKGSKPKILESHSQTTNSFSYSMFASQEGVYEVISIADKFCQYSAGKSGRKD